MKWGGGGNNLVEIILEGALRCGGGMMDSYNSFVLSARWRGGGGRGRGAGGVGFFLSIKVHINSKVLHMQYNACAQFYL
jgi:hypothetical protein